ncbi:MAG: hypothetical protein KJZ86_25850 [Caldilineaceae bacterium]|nr:hypothetical protein [Caldilineaceae bacterium]HRJ44157.1 hypothetical protein [Caldilineaceae bacterium]
MKQTTRLTGAALWGLLVLALLAACGPGGEKALIPAGAAQGQATFLYFYTEA